MAIEQSDLDNLLKAIASGVREVRTADGRRVTYQNAAEMMDAVSLLRMELDTASRTTFAEFHRYERSER